MLSLPFFSQWVGEEAYCHGQPCFSNIGVLRLHVDLFSHYAVSFMTGLMNDQDMSVLFHCVSVNFAPMSTFLKAAVTNKEICL